MDPKTTAAERSASMAGSALVMAVSGQVYMWSSVATQIGARFGYSSTELNIVGSLGNSAQILSPLMGRLSEVIGPTKALVGGGALAWLAATTIGIWYTEGGQLNHWILGGVYLLLAIAWQTGYFTVLGVNVRNFPLANQGLAVAVPVGLYGLSSALVALLFLRPLFMHQGYLDVGGFFIFDGVLTFAIFALSALLVRDYRRAHTDVLPQTEPNHEDSFSPTPSSDSSYSASEDSEQDALLDFPKPSQETSEMDSDLGVVHCYHSFGSLEAYLMWCIHGSVVGVALLYINNIGVILLSLQPSPVDSSDTDLQKLQSAHVTLISVFNFAGRIVIGALVDFLMSGGAPSLTDMLGGLRCLPETLTIVSATTMMAGHVHVWNQGRMATVDVEGAERLWASSVLVGFANGAVHVTSPLVIGKFWGREFIGTNVALIYTSITVGGQLLNFAFGRILDSHRPVEPAVVAGSTYDPICRGWQCTHTAFALSVCVAAAASLLAVWMRIRSGLRAGKAVLRRRVVTVPEN